MANNNKKKKNGEDFTLLNTVGLPLVESAGGLVNDGENSILLMFKRGKWDLPKGRIDEGDSVTETALREVYEETGLDIGKLEILGKLVPTWHTTRHGGKQYLKKTHWYMMRYTGNPDHYKPQVEEGIIECRWVHLSDLDHYLNKIHPRIYYLINFWQKNLAYVPRK